jgi:hypothetical protein
MDAKDDEIIDHQNHNTLDNRRLNLRKTTYQNNNRNRTIINKESKLAGVHFTNRNKLWIAQIKIDNKTIHLIGDKDKHKVELIRLKAEQIAFGDFSPNKNMYSILDNYEYLKDINTIEELKEYYRVKNKIGDEHSSVKLTDKQVVEIRQLLKDTGSKQIEIAKMYNVSKYIISRINLNKTYKNLKVNNK